MKLAIHIGIVHWPFLPLSLAFSCLLLQLWKLKSLASQPVARATQGRLLLDECLFLVALLQNRREVCGPVRRT